MVTFLYLSKKMFLLAVKFVLDSGSELGFIE